MNPSTTPIIISREALDAVNAAQMAPRGVPTLEPHGQPGALGRATCSLPVSSADFFYGWLRARADRFRSIGVDARSLDSAAEDFRRDMGLPLPRQPEENTTITQPGQP